MTARRVRFSIQTPLEGASFAVLARHWQTAERLGYDEVWLDDHFYGAVGVTHFIAMFGRVDRLEATELFARDVTPAFRSSLP